jgi:hypothetical protein
MDISYSFRNAWKVQYQEIHSHMKLNQQIVRDKLYENFKNSGKLSAKLICD